MFEKNFSYYIKIFGCQMNHTDAERIVSTLVSAGGESANDPQNAQSIIVLSCGVRQSAEERIISWIKRTKKENPKAEIILTGCLSHREDIKERLKGTTGLFITIENWSLKIGKTLGILTCRPELGSGSTLRSRNEFGMTIREGECVNRNFYQISPTYASTFRAYIPIITGCNNFCAYCVVPFARGRETSRSPEDVIDEIKKCLNSGAKEIYLLGQNVASYKGVDKTGQIWTFAKLLRKIDGLSGKFWIRFVSTHPKDVNDEFIKAFAKGKKVSPNLHLPVQSGSDRVLARMNRKYRRQEYLDKIQKLYAARPETVLSSDIIVGFPGEKEQDFRDSLDIVKKAGFEMLYTLKYSPRPETAAFKLEDDVPIEIKKTRQQQLDQAWKRIAVKKNRRFLGKSVVILIEKIKTKKDERGQASYFVLGKNFENKDVSAPVTPNKNLLGKWAVVKITKIGALGMLGKLIKIEK